MLEPSPWGGMGLSMQVGLVERGDCQLCAVLLCDAAPCSMAVIFML